MSRLVSYSAHINRNRSNTVVALNRRHIALALVATLLLGGAFLLGGAEKSRDANVQVKTLRATTIEIVNAQNEPVLTLSADQQGGRIVIATHDGETMLSLGGDREGYGLASAFIPGDMRIDMFGGVDSMRVLLQSQIQTMTAQSELHRVFTQGKTVRIPGGNWPAGWGDLSEGEYLNRAPINPTVDGPNSSKVIVRESIDVSRHGNYGWIFNPKTGEFWPANIDADWNLIARDQTASADY